MRKFNVLLLFRLRLRKYRLFVSRLEVVILFKSTVNALAVVMCFKAGTTPRVIRFLRGLCRRKLLMWVRFAKVSVVLTITLVVVRCGLLVT